MALGGAAWRNETRSLRRAMPKTPRPNTGYNAAIQHSFFETASLLHLASATSLIKNAIILPTDSV